MPIYFDKEIIQTILDNLISNALKYTEKGSISIGIRQVERAEVNYTEIRVSDTGYGIKPEALPHIIDRYYQEGGKHQASGTGIWIFSGEKPRSPTRRGNPRRECSQSR